MPGKPEELDRSSRLGQIFSRQMTKLRFLPSEKRYNLTISHEKNFVWFRVAKVGTRTILHHFRTNGVVLDAEHPYFVHYSPKLYANYLKFAFTRNPWERLVSCWVDKVANANDRTVFNFSDTELGRMKQFGSFVEYVATLDITNCNNHIRSQCALIDLNNVDYIGRMETFAADFSRICHNLKIPWQTIIPINVTSRKFYREYYTDKLRDKVFEIYRKDIQVFGYEF
jgi:hypothetical protein